MDFVWHMLVAAGLFLAIDSVWLVVIANKFYKKHLGKIMADKPNLKAAGLFYALYMVGIVFFAVNPALKADDFGVALGHGALLGLVMYATYDLTNEATLKDWKTRVTVIDLCWGTFITATVSSLTFLIFR